MLRRNLLDLRPRRASSRRSSGSSSSTSSSPGSGSSDAVVGDSSCPRLVAFLVLTVLTGARLSARRHRASRRWRSRTGGRLTRRARTASSSARADRPAVRRGRATSSPRPSAAGDGYDAMSSSASNLGPTNPDAAPRRPQRASAAYRTRERARRRTPPSRSDAVTASGSGLDPQISRRERTAAGRPRRARTGPRTVATCSRLIDEHTDGRSLGFLGEPGVNVLELNLALDGTAVAARFGHGARDAPHLPRRRGRRRQDVRDARTRAAGAPSTARTSSSGSSRRTGAEDGRADRRPRGRPAAAGRVPRRDVRGDGRRRRPRAPPAGRARRRARAHERPRLAEREALAGCRGASRRGHRRDLDAERPAPRVPQRRRRADHRRHAARDDPRRGRAPRRRAPARRPHAARAPQPARPRRRLPARAHRHRARATTSAPATSPPSASWPSPGSPTGWTRLSPTTAHATASTEPWETRERVLVALTGSADGERLVRRAARMAQRTKGELVGRPRHPAGRARRPLGRAARAPAPRSSTSSAARTTRSSGADVAEALLDAARSLNVTQIVMGASRRSRWQRMTRGSVIGRVIRESGVGIDVHVISHPDGRSEDALSSRARAALPHCRRSACSSASASPQSACRFSTWTLPTSASDLGLPSVMLLYLLLVVAVVGARRPLAGARRRGRRVPARQLVLRPPLHTFTIGEARTSLRWSCSSTVAASMSGFVALAARRAVEGAARPGRGGSARATRRIRSGRRRSSTALPRARPRGRGRPPPQRTTAGGSMRRPATHPESPEAGRDHDRARPRPRPRACRRADPRSEDQRVLDAFATRARRVGRSSASSRRRLEAAGALAAANELRAALLVRRLARPADAARRPSRPPSPACSRTTSSGPAEARDEFLATIDEETDRLDCARRQPPRHEPPPDRRARASAPPPVGLDEVLPAALTSIGAPAGDSRSTSPEHCPACSPTPGCSSARSRT